MELCLEVHKAEGVLVIKKVQYLLNKISLIRKPLCIFSIAYV